MIRNAALRLSSLCILVCIYSLSSCSAKQEKQVTHEYSTSAEKSEPEDDEDESTCHHKDGTYSASVDYYNPSTGHTATYDLTVEVEDCQVIQINFNNGGWLDETHIDPADLSDDGDAELEDDQGRQFSVHID